MGIHYVKGDIFESDVQTLVNAVNCVGVMGTGIALEFKKRYPLMFSSYKKICDQKLLTPAKLHLFKENEKIILNFPTKNHWRDGSKLEWIDEGLIKFVSSYKEKGIVSIAFPQLGCGKGGLNWDDVKFLMEKYLSDLEINVFVYIS